MLKKLKDFGWGYILLGAVLAAVGICFIAFNNAFSVLAICLGIILAVFGILFGVVTLTGVGRGVAFALKIALAVSCLICGTVTAIVREPAISVITDIFCLLLIVDGSFKLQTSITSRKFRVVGWWLMLALAVSVIISAFLLAKLSGDNVSATSVVIGIIITADGIANLLTAFYRTANESRIAESLADTDEGGEDRE